MSQAAPTVIARHQFSGHIMSDQPPPPSEPPSSSPASPPPGQFPQSGASDPAPAKKAWWKRWWGITLIVFALLVVLAAIVDGEEDPDPVASDEAAEEPAEDAGEEPADEEPRDEPAPEADEPEEESAPEPEPDGEPAPEPEPEEEPAPEPESTFEAVTVEGSGDDIIDVPAVDDAPLVATLTHAGSSNFAVTSFSPDGDRVDLMVNVIGNYEGTVPYNFQEVVAELEINADGPWTVTISDLRDQPTIAETPSGTGDMVLLHDGTGGRLSLTHDGDSNFAVRGWETRRQLLVNEIGAYEGTVRMDPAVALEIAADGNWTLSLD